MFHTYLSACIAQIAPGATGSMVKPHQLDRTVSTAASGEG